MTRFCFTFLSCHLLFDWRNKHAVRARRENLFCLQNKFHSNDKQGKEFCCSMNLTTIFAFFSSARIFLFFIKIYLKGFHFAILYDVVLSTASINKQRKANESKFSKLKSFLACSLPCSDAFQCVTKENKQVEVYSIIRKKNFSQWKLLYCALYVVVSKTSRRYVNAVRLNPSSDRVLGKRTLPTMPCTTGIRTEILGCYRKGVRMKNWIHEGYCN